MRIDELTAIEKQLITHLAPKHAAVLKDDHEAFLEAVQAPISEDDDATEERLAGALHRYRQACSQGLAAVGEHLGIDWHEFRTRYPPRAENVSQALLTALAAASEAETCPEDQIDEALAAKRAAEDRLAALTARAQRVAADGTPEDLPAWLEGANAREENSLAANKAAAIAIAKASELYALYRQAEARAYEAANQAQQSNQALVKRLRDHRGEPASLALSPVALARTKVDTMIQGGVSDAEAKEQLDQVHAHYVRFFEQCTG